MNIEQTLEALGTARLILCGAVDEIEFRESIRIADLLQSLHDALPALIADAEAHRKMKEAGPCAWANVDRYGDHHYHGINQLPQGRHHLYALPDEAAPNAALSRGTPKA